MVNKHGWHRVWVAAPGSLAGLAVDLALGGCYLAGVLIERMSSAPVPADRLAVSVAVTIAIAAGLAARRNAPLSGYAVSTAAIVVESAAHVASTASPYANLIGAYSVGLYATRRRAWAGLVAIVAGVLGYFAAAGLLTAATGVLLAWLVAWAVGYTTARRREQQRVAQRLMRQQAIADERSRIARELHDLIGHAVNLMLVQAGAGRRVLDRDPAQARELLTMVERTGREALAELDHMLAVLRDDQNPSSDTPGVPDLPALAQRMTQAGLRVRLTVDPAGAPLPRSLDVSVYRIVQEALTNALKHGEAGSATVVLGRDGGAVQLDVHDDGQGPQPGYAPGRGLLGVGERVALFGGSLEHGPGPSGGFRLRARLPIPAGSPG